MGIEAPGAAGLGSRRVALAALTQCLEKGRALDDAFDVLVSQPPKGNYKPLSPSDKGFAWAIVQEVVRQRLRLKRLKRAFLKRPIPRKASAIHTILDIGLVQLLVMDVAPHAAISTSVDLAKYNRDRSVNALAPLVNGLLRNVARRQASGELYLPQAIHALPEWLAKRWTSRFGASGAAGLAEQFLKAPDVHVSAKTPDAKMALMGAPGAAGAGTITRLPVGTAIAQLPGFSAGDLWAQDRSAALPAHILAPEAGALCYDLCAAPGGKTLQLASMGAQVHAVDVSAQRLERLEDNLKRTGLSADVETADLLEWTPPVAAPYVLLDAPCTAIGTFQRHPDVVHHRRERDIEESAKRQAALLDVAWRALMPGGRMVYAVCSIEPEEGPDRIKAFVFQTPDATVTELKPSDFDLPQDCAHDSGGLMLLPHILAQSGGGDGFFISCLTRAV